MKFGIEFVPYIPSGKLLELVKMAEGVGFDYCWVTDHYNNRNVYCSLAVIAQGTQNIKICAGATNPYVAHPAITASAIASVDEISNGRAVLGIAAGDKTTLQSLGVDQERPVTALSEAIEIMKRLWAGERVSFDGKIFRVAGASLNFKPKGKIPIYLGAQGPRVLKLAGEIADGALINASHPLDFKDAISHLRGGAEGAGRDLKDIDVAAYTSFSIADSKDKAEKAARPVVAFIISAAPAAMLERHGIPMDQVSEIKKALSSGNIPAAASLVTGAMLDSFCVYGTPSECIKKVEEISKAGVTQFVVGSPIGPDPASAMRRVGDEIMPAFKG